MVQVNDDFFNSPGQVRISPEALAEARKFAAAVGALNHGAQIVSIDWAPSVVLRDPGQPEQQVGPCLMTAPIDAIRCLSNSSTWSTDWSWHSRFSITPGLRARRGSSRSTRPSRSGLGCD